MALTDKFNFYLDIYKTLNPGVGTGVNALDGFLQFVKKRYPSFYNQAQAQVREILRQAQPQTSGGGEKPPTKPPVNQTPEPPENPNNGDKGKASKPGTYKATDNKQVQKNIANKQIDKLYNKPTSADALKSQFNKVSNGAGKVVELGKKAVESPVGKSVTAAITNTPGGQMLKSVAPAVISGALAAPTIYNAAVNWNAPGSDWATRTLDVSAPIDIIGMPLATGYLTKNPIATTAAGTAGFVRASQAMNDAKNRRERNVGLQTNSVTNLSPDEEAAAARYIQTGQPGQLHPNYTKGVQGSTLPADYVAPDAETVALANQGQVNPGVFSANPPITSLPPLPQAGAVDRPVITGDGSALAAINNSGTNNANFVPINEQQQSQPILQNNAMAPAVNGTEFNMYQVGEQLLNPEGQITPQQMREYINQSYDSLRGQIAQNPLYGGEYVQPGGYQVDPKVVNYYSNVDMFTKAMGGSPRNLTQGYLDRQRQLYNTEMANRAGVPYEDYVAGMKERNDALIKAEYQQVQDQILAYAEQAKTQQQRVQAYQALMKAQLDTRSKLQENYQQYLIDSNLERIKGQYGVYGNLINAQSAENVANINKAGSMMTEQMKLNDPYNQLNKTGQFYANAQLAFYNNPQGFVNMIASLPPAMQTALVGRPLTPGDANNIFAVQQAVQNNPSAFEQFLMRYSNINGR